MGHFQNRSRFSPERGAFLALCLAKYIKPSNKIFTDFIGKKLQTVPKIDGTRKFTSKNRRKYSCSFREYNKFTSTILVILSKKKILFIGMLMRDKEEFSSPIKSNISTKVPVLKSGYVIGEYIANL